MALLRWPHEHLSRAQTGTSSSVLLAPPRAHGHAQGLDRERPCPTDSQAVGVPTGLRVRFPWKRYDRRSFQPRSAIPKMTARSGVSRASVHWPLSQLTTSEDHPATAPTNRCILRSVKGLLKHHEGTLEQRLRRQARPLKSVPIQAGDSSGDRDLGRGEGGSGRLSGDGVRRSDDMDRRCTSRGMARASTDLARATSGDLRRRVAEPPPLAELSAGSSMCTSGSESRTQLPGHSSSSSPRSRKMDRFCTHTQGNVRQCLTVQGARGNM